MTQGKGRKAKQVDVVVARGTVVLEYKGDPNIAVNNAGVEYVTSMGAPVEAVPGDRILLDADEAEKLLAAGVVKLPMTEGDPVAPVGADKAPAAGSDAAQGGGEAAQAGATVATGAGPTITEGAGA